MPSFDRKDFHWFMGVKFALSLYVFKQFNFLTALAIFVTFFVCYRHVIAKLLGLQVMSIGDFNTYVTSDKAPTNIMTATPVSEGRPELASEAFMRIVKAHIKARSCIRVVLGDMYY